jgi:hypothetical protein
MEKLAPQLLHVLQKRLHVQIAQLVDTRQLRALLMLLGAMHVHRVNIQTLLVLQVLMLLPNVRIVFVTITVMMKHKKNVNHAWLLRTNQKMVRQVAYNAILEKN